MVSDSRARRRRRAGVALIMALAWSVSGAGAQGPRVLTDAQKERLKERDRLGERQARLLGESKPAEALAAAEAKLAIEREVLGESSDDALGTLELVANLREALGDWAESASAWRRAEALRAGLRGADHWKTIDARFAAERAEAAMRMGEADRRRLAEARNLTVRSNRLYRRRQYAEAERPIRQALDLNRELLGEKHRDAVRSLSDLGEVLRARGDLAAARPLLERALRMRREILGERHPDTINSLSNLGVLLSDQGDYAAARPLLERALGLSQEVLGERHPDTIRILQNLATALWTKGDYVAARPLLERALRLSQEVLGERHPDTIPILNNLGMNVYLQGDYASARSMFERALRLGEAMGGERHPDALTALSNLAMVLQDQGDLDGARTMYERALSLRQDVLGERHPDTIESLNKLAVLKQKEGDLAGARPLFERALHLRQEVLGDDHQLTIISLSNLASLLQEQGDFAGARSLYERAARQWEKAGGMVGRARISHLTNMALLLRDLGDIGAASDLTTRALASSDETLGSTLPALSEREQIALLAAWRRSLNLTLTLSAGRPAEDGRAYAAVLALKGLAAEADAARRDVDRPEAREIRARLVPLRAGLGALTNSPVPPAGADARARQLRALADEVAALESKLARAVDWHPSPPAVASLAAAIPEGTFLVDFLRYRYYPPLVRGTPRPATEPRYAAFVIGRGAAAAVRVELGPAAPIDEALAAWRGRMLRGRDDDELGRRVAALVWAPIEPRLGGATTVLVSPDGDLCFLPWGALPGPAAGERLLMTRAFAVIPSGRQLLALAGPPAGTARGGLLVAGGVDYAGAGPSRAVAGDRASASFGPLPATEAEAEEAARLFRASFPGEPSEDLGGAEATVARLAAAMPGKRFLHLATHGFFAPPRSEGASGLQSWEGLGRAGAAELYPGLLSGLAWAGAARPEASPGAGLMTAEEVSGLDLRGCQLCVLSACETGLGRAAGGEGVLGLQRAFHRAGCRTVVASLWRVDDAATMELMGLFYENLWNGKLPPAEALRRSQLSLLDRGRGPALWAGWALSGDPGGLGRSAP